MVFFSFVINIILSVMSCHDHLRWISSYTLNFREYPQLTHMHALQFLVLPIVFMHIILQIWTWLKSNNLTILVMGNNGFVQCKLTFVQASYVIYDISDNNNIIVWKTIFSANMRYKRIQCDLSAGTYRCFSEGTLWKLVCLPFFFSPPNRTYGNLTSFSHSYMRSYLKEFRSSAYVNGWSNMAQPCDMDLWVMKWRSAWPIFHGPVILPYILKTYLMYVHHTLGVWISMTRHLT